MESKISLALAAKIILLFQKEDTFLTFPLGVVFSNRFLSFMKSPSVSGLSAQERYNNQAEFARLFNVIPEDSIKWIPDPNRLLWDELNRTLRNCSYAVSALSEGESRLLDEAIDFLTDIQMQDGREVPVSSTAVLKYHEYERAYDEAERTYLDEKFTAENSGNDELKRQWIEYKEKQLHDIMDKALEEWKNLGFKVQVEYYQSLRDKLEIKKYPILYGQQYQNEINLAAVPDPAGSGAGFYSTYFSPSDVFDTALPWITITLTKGEIEALFQDAPEELKKIFDASQGSTDIESVSLEYSDVAIFRPWYKREFFTSRYWKLPDNAVISDGFVPRKGSIPAYITSMIVVRNVKVSRRRPPVGAPQPMPFVLPVLVSSIALEPLRYRLQSTQVIRPQNIVLPAIALSEIQPIRVSPVSVHRMARAEPAQKMAHQPMTIKSLSFLIGKKTQVVLKEPTIINPPNANERRSYLKAKFIGTTMNTTRKKRKFISIRRKKDLAALQGYFFIKSKLNGMVLDIAGMNSAAGADLITWPRKDSGTENQLWAFEPGPEGYFFIKSKLNGMVLDIAGMNSAAGADLITWPRKDSGTENQLWALESELVTENYNFDGVVVLAFVCKRMPRSPNPDNTLQWSE
jgi:Ricin-type beta-trefoil lectin domain-like